MKNKIVCVAGGIITAIVIIIVNLFILFVVCEFFDMLKDHYCYELPPQEFINDPKCADYWGNK